MYFTDTNIPSFNPGQLKGFWWLPVQPATSPVPLQPQPPASKIPYPLLAQLESLRTVLAKHGTLQYRPDRGLWRIRYSDKTEDGAIRRSITVGKDDNLACEVDLWLEKARRERQVELSRVREEKQAQHQQKIEKRVEHLRRRLYIKMATKGGRDRKAWAWQQYRALAHDPIQRLGFVMMLPNLPAPKMGRPRKGLKSGKENIRSAV